MNHIKQLTKYYGNLWKFASGAMVVSHELALGLCITAALVKRNPLAAVIALLVTLIVAVALIPVCSLWDLER